MGNKVYSIKQVAAMLGIPTVTLRAWENRYSAVTPERTESGYRLYTEENVADLRWLKEQVAAPDKYFGSGTHAQEHFMTQLISQRFYQFFHLFPIYPHLPKVLALCPEGEHHQVGLLLFSLFMRKNGAEVLYLGADTPEEGIYPIIREQNIRLVCLSVTSSELLERCDQLIGRILDEFPDMRFVLGDKGYERAESARYPQWIMPKNSANWQSWMEREYFVEQSPGRR
ncbi:MerR family transcriptional regulator [Paenibacillus sp. NPDC057886]|uniref:MerR family transcriptional regulator n=1 Tax=Paenibacillus sp. NPDC057886 TaxID=3346270 RepID=UPI00367F5B4A